MVVLHYYVVIKSKLLNLLHGRRDKQIDLDYCSIKYVETHNMLDLGMTLRLNNVFLT